ncbi:hypothetical protein [Nocardioides sp. AN3]
MPRRLLNLESAGAEVAVSRVTAWTWARDGRLGAVCQGRRVFVTASSVAGAAEVTALI